jgi:hypothetical protein
MKINIECLFCKKIFQVKESRKTESKYCSYICYWKDKKGKPSKLKGIKFTEEHKRNISKAQRVFPDKFCRDCGIKLKNRWTAIRCKICCKKGERNPFYGKKHNLNSKTIIRFTRLGKKHSKEVIDKLRIIRSGKGNPRYIDGRKELTGMIRDIKEGIEWKKQVLNRDNYICQECKEKKSGYLCAHHIRSFSSIFQDFLNEYSQFSPIEDKETLVRLAISYQPFWDIDNGVTLCVKCHKEFHKNRKIFRNVSKITASS